MYETGFVVAFVLWVTATLINLFSQYSQFGRNLKKVGLRVSLFTGQPTAKSNRSNFLWTTFKIVIYVVLGWVSWTLSWAYVFLVAVVYLHRAWKNQGMPAAVKEYTWKLKNMDLTAAEIEEGAKAMNAALGRPA